MAPKKKIVVEETPAEKPEEKPADVTKVVEWRELEKDELITAPKCGHVNRQRPDGKPLTCTLPKGHSDSDHSCSYNGGRAVWSDAAGEPL
ncbi:MAG: hypothetical protein EHM40_02785 [Chloroflexi bacterium]|nr:MAG: hypothetical protein EHM40_02785 [Chloroflexota bacterium]